MFFPEGQASVFLVGEPVNMRPSHHGLVALADHPMRQDLFSGDLFVFTHRRHADDDTSDVGQSQCGDPGMLKKRISTLPE